MISLCIKDNNSNLQDFLSKNIACSNIPNIYYSSHIFKNYQNTIVHYKGTDIDEFYKFMTKIISSAIIKFYEPRIVKKLISKNYFYFNHDEQTKIYKEYSSIEPNRLR